MKKFYYEKIPELEKFKSIFSDLKYKDIELWPSMAPACYYYQHYKTLGSSGFKIARILKFLFFREKFDFKIEKDKILASILIDRKDHHSLWEKALGSFGEEEIVKIDSFRSGKKGLKNMYKRFGVHFPNIFKITGILWNLHKAGFGKDIGFLDKMYLSLLAYFQLKKIDYWNKVYEKLNPKAYIAYSSYRNNDETIMTQIMNKNKKTTFTMQNYSLSEFKQFNYETITYENFISNYFLTWGESSKDLLGKFISQNKLIVAGNPLYEEIELSKKTEFNPKICSVFLSHRQFNESNNNLTEVVNEFAKNHPKIEFKFSIHPDSNEQEFLSLLKNKNMLLIKKGTNKDDILRESDFIILHNSSISLEGLKYQIPILRFKDKFMLEKDLPENTFMDIKGLEIAFKKMFDKASYKKYAKLCFEYYIKNFFQSKNGLISENYKKKIQQRIN